jgi:hypothetical protein
MPEASSVLSSGDPAPQQQVYEAESSQEYFKREEDGKVLEEVRDAQQRQNIKNLHFARSVCFWVSYSSQTKEQLFPLACNGERLCLV